MKTRNEILIYQFVKQLPDTINRSQRRQVAAEYKMVCEKLGNIVRDYENELFDRQSFSDDRTFVHYNERFQKTASFLGSKLKFHAVHRGWFYLMYKHEKIGVMREEERTSNAFANWTMKTLARPLMF